MQHSSSSSAYTSGDTQFFGQFAFLNKILRGPSRCTTSCSCLVDGSQLTFACAFGFLAQCQVPGTASQLQFSLRQSTCDSPTWWYQDVSYTEVWILPNSKNITTKILFLGYLSIPQRSPQASCNNFKIWSAWTTALCMTGVPRMS